ncbi:WXG100 family type VII secretion target [Buchananella felis]|uniref:WXG100 family type VII secretion target n=1 Tax=Buchananella felis TaxID=3231492 RepID=UPI0035278DEA
MRFQVDSAEVAAAAARTRASMGSISAEVSAMMSHLTALQSSWTGSASAAFAAVAEEWRATQAVVESNLEMIGLQLDAAANTYSAAESQAAGMFGGR